MRAGSAGSTDQQYGSTDVIRGFRILSHSPQEENLVNKLKPDAFIGVPDWAAKLGIPITHVLDGKRPTMGYDGLLYLVKYIKGGV
ncbi:hypothetical protein [Coprococcus sp. HCN-4056]|uniref:hypothetical protein n=1 Tax=Coprococcus sp. HCN-4056 TaxID=3134671 RepID=UPI0030C411F4